MIHTRSPATRLCSIISEMSRCRCTSDIDLKSYLESHSDFENWKDILKLKSENENYIEFARRLAKEKPELFFRVKN